MPAGAESPEGSSLALGLWTPLWGSAQGGVGRKQASPAQPSPGRADGAGVGRSGQEQPPPEARRQAHMACHTLTGHTILDHTCGDADVYVRARTHTHTVHPHTCTPSSHKTQTFTAHTCSYNHTCSYIPCTTSPRPHTHCLHTLKCI